MQPKEKTAEALKKYYDGIRKDPTAAIVKALDRCNNISTMMSSFPKNKLIEYINETQDYVLPLLDHIKHGYRQYYDASFVIDYQIKSVLESIKAAILRL